MSISTKLTYLNNTKNAIKEAIENKGVSVPSNTTFRNYASKIGEISVGGVKEKDVNFYDYDGTLLYSYTLAEAQALEALPELPTAPFDYTADSWTETLAFVKALTRPWNIGVNYTTTRTGTEIDIEVPEADKTVYCSCDQSGNTVDWGDGTVDTVSTSSSLISHTYANSGNYTVTYGDGSNRKIRFQQTKCLNPYTEEQLTSSATSMLFQRDTLYLNGQTVHPSNLIKAVRFGNKVENGITDGYTCFSSQKLEYFILPKGAVTTLNKAFRECPLLRSVTIPSSVTSIGSDAFNGCRSLQSVTIGSGVTSIGGSAFQDCPSLQSLTIPDSVTSIESYAFNGCPSLQSLTIPDGVTSIGDSTFFGCSSLQSVTIPDRVTSIGSFAFYKCSLLQSVTIPDGVTSIGSYAFSSCPSLHSVTIPDGVTSIGSYTFSSCSSLKSVTIPDGVTSIEGNAFYFCKSLQSITIPDGVTSIGSYAFSYCSWLNEVHVEATTPPTLENTGVFSSNYSTRKIYVPYSSDHSILNAYKEANNWSAYADYIVEASS